jgi:RsiW-degrading membrane proteinase PrsW (M82 family)
VKYLVFCFTWGAFVAVFGALMINRGALRLFEHLHLYWGLVPILVAPVVEETMKATGPVLLFFFRRRAFSGIIDGIVFCGLSAVGFAFVENILYLGGYGYAAASQEGGALAGVSAAVQLFLFRIILSGFAHPLFTAMTGIGLGIAARTSDRKLRWLAPLSLLPVAMVLHASWNLMAIISDELKQPLIALYGYFAVMVPIFLGVVGFALWLRAAEGRLTDKILPEYVRRGWLAPPEVATLHTVGRRLAARHWARRVAGEQGAKAMGAYQFDLTKLALLRDGMYRGLGVAPGEIDATLAEERRLLDAVVAYRKVFTGRDPRAPHAIWDGQRYHVMFPDGVVRAIAPPDRPVVPVPVRLGPLVPAAAYGYPPAPYR